MSASERLVAIVADLEAAEVWDYGAAGCVLDVLPELVEVVRAAELKPLHVYVGIRDENDRPTGRVRYPLVEALAALDAKLGESR